MKLRLFGVAVLVAALSAGVAGCGRYSISNIRSLKAFQDANNLYKKAEYKAAIERYEASIHHNPELGFAYFFLGNSYDNLYKPAKKGEPDNDVNLVVVPPPLLTDSLKAGRVDGFCVGQPWNSVAVAEGHGVILATKNALWPMSPEKVLGVRESWAAEEPELLARTVRAGFRITEVGVHHCPRQHGKPTGANPLVIARAFYELFKLYRRITGEARAADVVALSDGTAIEIAKDALQPVLIDHPELAAAISAKVTERRGNIASLRMASNEEAQRTMLSRIRAYFGL